MMNALPLLTAEIGCTADALRRVRMTAMSAIFATNPSWDSSANSAALSSLEKEISLLILSRRYRGLVIYTEESRPRLHDNNY